MRVSTPKAWDRSASINRGLAAWWPLASGATGAAQELVRGIPGVGTSVGAGVLRYGKTATFGGSSSFAIPALSTASRAWSFACRIKTSSSAAQFIFRMNREGPTYEGWGVSLGYVNGVTAGRVGVYSSANGGGGWVGSTSSTYADGVEHLIVVTYDGTNVRFYRDGVPDGVAASNARATYTGSCAIGQALNGSMQNVRVWNRCITPGEVALLVREPWAGLGSTPRRRAGLASTNYPLTAEGITRQYSFGAATFTRGFPLTAEGLRRRYSFGDATITFSGAVLVDTHDGFKRRSRRERALDAAAERAREEWVAERNGLRLALEAAMGMAAEVEEEAPPEAVEAVQEAAQAARAVMPVLSRPTVDAAAIAQARRLVADLQEAVAEAARLRALAEDDEEVLMLLRAL